VFSKGAIQKVPALETVLRRDETVGKSTEDTPEQISNLNSNK